MDAPDYGKQVNFADGPDYGKQVNFTGGRECGEQVNFADGPDYGKRAARTVLTGMCYSFGNATRQGSSSLTRFIGQSAITSSTWRR